MISLPSCQSPNWVKYYNLQYNDENVDQGGNYYLFFVFQQHAKAKAHLFYIIKMLTQSTDNIFTQVVIEAT